MITFKKMVPGIELLETPFGSLWTGIVLVRGEQNILIDSGADAASIDNYLIPALHETGLRPCDIDWLLNTHCHGDHIGGHYRTKELTNCKIATFSGSLDKIRNPLKYSKLIRATFPKYSPAPPAVLLGVEPDVTVEDGEIFGGRLQLIHTPGHDSDTVCWFDIPTGTLISGDSLQANGTTTQGIGLYMDLPGYVSSLARLSSMEIENIIAGHPYLPCGSVAKGKKQVAEYLNICTELVGFYNNFIRDELKSGEHDAVVIARRLIEKVGGIIPEYMFLPLYTVTEHLKAIS